MYFLRLFSFIFLSTQFNFCLGYLLPDGLRVQLQRQSQCASKLPETFVPVFIPNDQYGNVNYETIPIYLDFLKDSGVTGVYLFSALSDGLLRTREEKILLMKTFAKETKRCNLVLAVQVGWSDYNDTLTLASYAKRVGVESVLSGPELYYAAPTIQDVVEYLQPIAEACYPLQFLYTDLVMDSTLGYSTTGVVNLLKKTVKNFVGVLSNLVGALETVAVHGNSDIFVFSGDSVDPISPYIYCLNGTSTLLSNIFPQYIIQVQQSALVGDISLATAIAKKINKIYYECIATACPQKNDRTLLRYRIQIGRLLMWIVNGIDLGNAPAPPLAILTLEQQMQCYRICQREGVAKRNPRDRPGYKYTKYYINNQDNYELNDKYSYGPESASDYNGYDHEYPGNHFNHYKNVHDSDNDSNDYK